MPRKKRSTERAVSPRAKAGSYPKPRRRARRADDEVCVSLGPARACARGRKSRRAARVVRGLAVVAAVLGVLHAL
jgi:hypothetical protein